MEVEVGDVFKDYYPDRILLFEVIKIESLNLITCNVYIENNSLGKSVEHKNTLLKMQKLTPLEKELM
jgi:hypothetical protein